MPPGGRGKNFAASCGVRRTSSISPPPSGQSIRMRSAPPRYLALRRYSGAAGLVPAVNCRSSPSGVTRYCIAGPCECCSGLRNAAMSAPSSLRKILRYKVNGFGRGRRTPMNVFWPVSDRVIGVAKAWVEPPGNRGSRLAAGRIQKPSIACSPSVPRNRPASFGNANRICLPSGLNSVSRLPTTARQVSLRRRTVSSPWIGVPNVVSYDHTPISLSSSAARAGVPVRAPRANAAAIDRDRIMLRPS